jgi:hypothetical protein
MSDFSGGARVLDVAYREESIQVGDLEIRSRGARPRASKALVQHIRRSYQTGLLGGADLRVDKHYLSLLKMLCVTAATRIVYWSCTASEKLTEGRRLKTGPPDVNRLPSEGPRIGGGGSGGDPSLRQQGQSTRNITWMLDVLINTAARLRAGPRAEILSCRLAGFHDAGKMITDSNYQLTGIGAQTSRSRSIPLSSPLLIP